MLVIERSLPESACHIGPPLWVYPYPSTHMAADDAIKGIYLVYCCPIAEFFRGQIKKLQSCGTGHVQLVSLQSPSPLASLVGVFHSSVDETRNWIHSGWLIDRINK